MYRTIHLSNINGASIREVLSSIPTINLKQYGGIGSLATPSIRGTGSNQTVISLNKIPLTTSANPFFDLNLLPVELINSVNIITNGSSSLFGSGSIGGTLDFETKTNKRRFISPYFSIGSFGYLKASISQNNIIPMQPKLSNSISYESYLGDYPITFNQFGEIIDTFRTNSKYKSLKLSNLFDVEINDKLIFNSISFFSSNYQEQPGAVLIGRLEDENDLLKQLNLISINSIGYKLRKSNLNFVNLLSIKNIDYNTNEELLNNQSRFSAFDMTNLLNYTVDSKIIGQYKIGLGFDYNQLVGNMLQKKIGNFIQRNNLYLSFSTNNLIFYLPINYSISLRIDKMFNYDKIAYSWLISLNYFLSDELKINAVASSNFRFPSFNEMYYFNYGNINLLPEKSISAETSLDYRSNLTNIQITGFINDINDKIVSIPKSTLIWTAQNFGKVMNYGVELSSQLFIFQRNVSINYNYILQTSFDNNINSKYYKSILPYIPQEKIDLSVIFNKSDFSFALNLHRNSYQYYLPENSIEYIIPSNLLINASLLYNADFFKSFPFYISLNINNLTDNIYEIVKNYPMPGRSITLTIGGKIEIE